MYQGCNRPRHSKQRSLYCSLRSVCSENCDSQSVTHLFSYRPEGCEDLLQDLQQSLLPAGGDVVLGQL